MITSPENKQLDPVAVAIANTEKAIVDAQAKADALASRLNESGLRMAEQLRGTLRPGQGGVILPPDPAREQLERDYTLAQAEVYRLERLLAKLRRA